MDPSQVQEEPQQTSSSMSVCEGSQVAEGLSELHLSCPPQDKEEKDVALIEACPSTQKESEPANSSQSKQKELTQKESTQKESKQKESKQKAPKQKESTQKESKQKESKQKAPKQKESKQKESKAVISSQPKQKKSEPAISSPSTQEESSNTEQDGQYYHNEGVEDQGQKGQEGENTATMYENYEYDTSLAEPQQYRTRGQRQRQKQRSDRYFYNHRGEHGEQGQQRPQPQPQQTTAAAADHRGFQREGQKKRFRKGQKYNANNTPVANHINPFHKEEHKLKIQSTGWLKKQLRHLEETPRTLEWFYAKGWEHGENHRRLLHSNNKLYQN
ncbi:hypothetical protein Pcinc_040881 [Petrolisthes cinctipes]|uniref:Uncharacterized protein n=1 Tax=Petrolisthes cinctipes TaxID=88211 RepID=A0AAE1EIA7_PETCI|nr:hypothetical protein Pcinc_040881 [Petrolisthes cinctipes]